jgi:MFS family permease
VIGLACLTAFLDLAGFSILFPLFPAMMGYYLGREGEPSLIGGLVAELRRFAGEGANAQFLVETLFGGILGSLYSLLQFAFAPLWGSLSDRLGRRRVLLATLGGTAASYALWFVSGSFGLLVAARLIGGIMAGNIAIVTATVADVTSPSERSKGMGLIGASIGLGFIFGPAIGAGASAVDLEARFPGGAAWGLNPFSFAALVALALALANWAWAWRRFPETLPPQRRGAHRSARTANPFALFRRVPVPGVMRTNLVYFLMFLAFSAIEFTLVFLAVERFGYTPRQNGMMFVFVGLLIVLVQGGLIRRLAPRFGERALTVAGLAVIAPGFVLIGFAQGQGMLYAGLACMAVGSALVMPCLSALVSRYAPAHEQGLALGTFRSVGALSRGIGPLLGGILYWRLGSLGPYLLGAAFLALPLAIALRLPPPPEAPAGGPEAPLPPAGGAG